MMQTVSGRIRVRVVPLGGVYTFAPAQTTSEAHRLRDESAPSRATRNDDHILRRIEHKRAMNGV
ncbi:MAG TPA: hypothetical protein VHA53_03565 [Nitrolancea sp.]|nr:hypothetical protein [Nitrolancea sp.]